MHMPRTLKFILGALCLLFIPLFAEIFSWEGWDWQPFDFAAVGVLLVAFGAALSYATGPRNVREKIFGAAMVVVVILAYVHIAVGIVDWLPLAGS